MLREAKELGIGKVWIHEQALQRIGANAWNVILLQQIEPLVGGAMLQFLAEHLVERIDIRRTGGDVGETRVGLHNVRFADSLEKAAPLAIVVGKHCNEAVLGLIRATMLRQGTRIARWAGGRIEGGALHVLSKYKLRHGLEHRDFDALANAGARL